jgi:ABC-type sugar transport system substrate-binding protein
MAPSTSSSRRRRGLAASAAVASVTALLIAGPVGASSAPVDTGSSASGNTDTPVAVALITKNSTNPFFIAMQEGAKEAAQKYNVDITIGAGAEDGDEQGQIELIENAIAGGLDGILITPNGPGVNGAITEARDAGLFVIALDTPTDPADIVDITFATDNFKAGTLIGQWAAAQLDGEKAVIALLDDFTDKIVTVDYRRDQGFLTGMGIDTADPELNGDEAPTGSYTGGAGGDYEIVCNEATEGSIDGGRTAMENCLTRNPDINVVYTINEPAANGAYNALDAAGATDGVLIVSVDGGCAGVQLVADGVIGATAQQYPLDMASLGVEAIANIARGGEPPAVTEGLDFYDTGVALVTDKPVEGLDSIDTTKGLDLCWG